MQQFAFPLDICVGVWRSHTICRRRGSLESERKWKWAEMRRENWKLVPRQRSTFIVESLTELLAQLSWVDSLRRNFWVIHRWGSKRLLSLLSQIRASTHSLPRERKSYTEAQKTRRMRSISSVQFSILPRQPSNTGLGSIEKSSENARGKNDENMKTKKKKKENKKFSSCWFSVSNVYEPVEWISSTASSSKLASWVHFLCGSKFNSRDNFVDGKFEGNFRFSTIRHAILSRGKFSASDCGEKWQIEENPPGKEN